MRMATASYTAKEISCRVTRTLLLYVREQNGGSLGSLLDGLPLDETYLSDTHNWVSHAFLQTLYDRMIDLLGDDNRENDEAVGRCLRRGALSGRGLSAEGRRGPRRLRGRHIEEHS